jgi:PAS domain-containing protein
MVMTLSAPVVRDALWQQAPVFMLVIDDEERVVDANPFAMALFGESIRGRGLAELVVQLTVPLDLTAWREQPQQLQRLHFTMSDGRLQSLMVRLFEAGDHMLLMGWPDVIELMQLQGRFVALNAELNSLNREVLKKTQRSTDSTASRITFWAWLLTTCGVRPV